MLGWGTAAAAAVTTAGCGAHPADVGTSPSASTGSASPSASTSPSLSPSPSPSHAPVPRPVPTKPVRTLAEYVAQTPGAKPFPSNAIALTIDDGPHAIWTPKILNLLAKYDVLATFCVIGVQVKGHPTLAKNVIGEGHHIANHTYNHPLSLPDKSARQISKEVVDAQDAIVRATGFTPRQFRSPGGGWSTEIFRYTAGHELTPIDWEIDPRDWSRPGTGKIVGKLLSAKPGDILLCHDGGGDRSETYNALKRAIPSLVAKGFTFVTL